MARRVGTDEAPEIDPTAEPANPLVLKPRESRIFVRCACYPEPEALATAVIRDEFAGGQSVGPLWDPCAGTGTIPAAAKALGLVAFGTDIHPRSPDVEVADFFDVSLVGNIAVNPPYEKLREFTERACELMLHKAAVLAPLGRTAAAHWLKDLPLARILLCAPRPSIPSAEFLESGGKRSGDRRDFCWLIFERGHVGAPTLGWLHWKPARRRAR